MISLPLTADDYLLSALPPKDLFSWKRTCRDHRERADAYMRRACNIETFLSKYFDPPQVAHFRYLQSQTQMIISGSTALQFFERVEYPNSDLDIYVEHSRKEEIVKWLVQIGYAFKPRRDLSLTEELELASPGAVISNDVAGYMGMANVYNFYKGDPERKIQLITSHYCPLQIILKYHSTCVMNVMTHEKAYAFYPKATFVNRRSLKCCYPGVGQAEAHQKYTDRGWAVVGRFDASELKVKDTEFTAGARHVGDSFCWTIDLLPKADLPEALIEINSWKFGTQWDQTMRLGGTSSEKLSFNYLATDYETHAAIAHFLHQKPTGQHDVGILELLRARRDSQLLAKSRKDSVVAGFV